MKDKKICCICKKPFEGYGNNPAPVMGGGECCDKCNADVVLPIRLAQAVKVRAADDIKTVYIPARTDTSYFHDYIYQKHEVRFIRGRLHFNESKNAAPFPSMVVVMRGHK